MQDKIAKLLALANDPGATEAEADTAMQMAAALMAKYGIEAPKSKIDRRRGHFDQPYDMWLVAASAELVGSHWYYYKTGDFVFVSDEVTRESAYALWVYLHNARERTYREHLPRGLSKTDRAEFRRTFKTAFGIRIRRRVTEIVNALKQNDEAAMAATGSRALVVASSIEQRINEAKNWLEAEGMVVITKARRSRPTRFGSGTAAGRTAADATPLRTEIGR